MVESICVNKTDWFAFTYLDQFSQLFLEKFIPFTLREEYHKQFVDLAHRVVVLLPPKRERVRKFIDGLTFSIRLQMDKETRADISFERAVEIARRIKMVCGQERGPVSDNRTHHFGGFSGALSGYIGTFGKGHPPRSFQSMLQASHGASGSRGPHVSHPKPLACSAPSTPISTPPIQSY
uniref:Uncharacterized protein n=1 Tax=Nicotiana tabacum TaxID=4097 RepID=A0A1S4ATY8_TOBAC|nr:PREDICTED: uncharacterized protein LOC107801264 [Nicotiana tabacum]XP_016480051.1 PREDICTED: uncharacterized protein LOC107801264 [Nicotiana tabacum]